MERWRRRLGTRLRIERAAGFRIFRELRFCLDLRDLRFIGPPASGGPTYAVNLLGDLAQRTGLIHFAGLIVVFPHEST